MHYQKQHCFDCIAYRCTPNLKMSYFIINNPYSQVLLASTCTYSVGTVIRIGIDSLVYGLAKPLLNAA